MVDPKEIRFNPERIRLVAAEIDEKLRQGETVAVIACNHNILEGIIDHYKDRWTLKVREYKDTIKITFKAKSIPEKAIILDNSNKS